VTDRNTNIRSRRGTKWKITPTLVLEDRTAVDNSVFRILAFAAKHRLDSRDMLRSFATEHWGNHRLRLISLLRYMDRFGTAKAMAAQRSFSQDVVLTLQVAEHFGIENQGWDEVLDREKAISLESAKLWSNNWWYWIMTGAILSLLALFVTFRIGYLTDLLIGEFQLAYPDSMETPIRMPSGFSTTIIFALGPIIVFSILSFLPGCRQFLNRVAAAIPGLRAMRHRDDKVVLRILAMTTQESIDERHALECLSQWHPTATVRYRLSKTLTLSEGQSSDMIWKSLVKTNFLRPAEYAAISLTSDPQIKAWSLRHLASNARERSLFRKMRCEMLIQPAIAVSFGVVVLWVASALFHTMSTLVNLLSRHQG
jgi:hypothetical protein